MSQKVTMRSVCHKKCTFDVTFANWCRKSPMQPQKQGKPTKEQSMTKTMAGKSVLITGATDGIGKSTALGLAKLGAHLTLVGRNPDKGAKVVNELITLTNNREIAFIKSDLSEMSEVRQTAETFIAQNKRLDVLINNVGGLFMSRNETREGNEVTLALNHMSYFLLTDRLLDLLKATAAEHGEARVVNVSSDAHKGTFGINLDDLQRRTSYSGWKRYCESKLANIHFTRVLAEKLKGTNVTVNALHPGFVASKFGHDNGLLGSLVKASQIFAISVDKGAMTSIHLASSPTVKDTTGTYFYKSKPAKISRAARNNEAAEKLWTITESLVKINA